MKKQSAVATIDDYLDALDAEKRAALEKLRKTINSIIPKAEECISYQMPAFRLNGKVVMWMGAGKNHCSLYPGAVLTPFKDELEGYETSKGTIRFQPSKPLPASLIRKLINARIEANKLRGSA